MTVQLQRATQYHYQKAVMAIFPLALIERTTKISQLLMSQHSSSFVEY